MNFKNDKRGMVRVIEALLASLLILSTLALIPPKIGTDPTHYCTLGSEGTQVLVSLDNNGMLSELIENDDWTSLKNCIQSVLPVNLWFNLTVFDENMAVLNDVFVSNGSPVSDDIVAVNYVSVTSGENYAVFLVQLQLAEVS